MNINATIIGQTIAFAFFVWFCMKYVWPPIMQALNDRQKKIADGIAAAERATKDLKLTQHKVTQELHEAKVQAQGIIDQASKRASQIIDESKDAARAEGERIVTAAQAEINQEVNRAKEELRKQVASIAVAGAGKILGEHLDEAANSRLVDQLADEI